MSKFNDTAVISSNMMFAILLDLVNYIMLL